MPNTVMIVEDERIIAKGIEKRLLSLGYNVAAIASNGEEAIKKAIEHRPDLILMDIHLGTGMDGIDTATFIRQHLDLPVVYLTAHSDDATLQRAKLAGPFGYILKPYEDRDLQIGIEIGLYQHHTQKQIRQNEQWLSAVLTSIGDGVIATDEEGHIRFLNALAERLTGWTQKEALGKSILDIFRVIDSSHQPVPNPAIEAMETGKHVLLAKNTLLIPRNGVSFPIDDCASPIRDAQGRVTGSVLIFRDITERRKLEDHLRHAQKMEAIGKLAGGIAHDFNNIMTVIIGTGEMMLNRMFDSSKREDLVRQIVSSGERASSLTRQIVAFSRKQILVTSVLNLNTIVKDIASMLSRLIGTNIELVLDTAADLGQIKADSSQISQVILNLVTNARDAMPMPKTGKLIISTSNTTLDAGITKQYPDVKPGPYVLLSISDTGCGMTEEVLEHLFEPFFTTKAVGEGTGLGLATVHGIVKQSNGHIEVISKPGLGTTFRIYLPRTQEPNTSKQSENKTGSHGHETILLVEDDEMVRQMTKLILEKNGYCVLVASNGVEALKVADAHAVKIHLLLTDVVMPQLSGRMVAERLQVIHSGIKVLYMSAYTEDVILRQGVEMGAANFIPKPFSLSTLTRKVREMLDH